MLDETAPEELSSPQTNALAASALKVGMSSWATVGNVSTRMASVTASVHSIVLRTDQCQKALVLIDTCRPRWCASLLRHCLLPDAASGAWARLEGPVSAVCSMSAPVCLPHGRASTKTRVCVRFEIQSFHHLWNSTCSLVVRINVPLCSSTQLEIHWELAQLPVTCGEWVQLDLEKRRSVSNK